MVNGDIFIVGTNASEISLPGVTQVTGSLNIDNNTAATVIDVSSLQSVGGSISIDGNTAATVIDIDSLQSVGESISIDGNTAATVIDIDSLQSVGGSISIDGDTAATVIDVSSLETVGTSISVDDNTAAGSIDLSSLLTVGTSISVNDNTAAGSIDISSLQTVGTSISVNDNTAAGSIDISSLQTVGASTSIGNNTAAGSIDLSSLQTANGDVTVANNGPCTNVILGALTTVIGNLTVESCGSGTFMLGSAAANGHTTVNTTGYTTVNGTTASGYTDLRNKTGEAAMTVVLPAQSFTTPVTFSLTRLDSATLVPEQGFDANNASATIDPVAAYQITFGVPTLNQTATLSFDVFLSGLDSATANALLAALTNGNATLATKGDTQGSQYQAFRICGSGGQPTPGGCVVVQMLDANGQPTNGTPAIVRFSNVVGHFSTWAVAIVTPNAVLTKSFNGLLSPYPAPPHTTTPTFKRPSVVPLKFKWVDAGGVIVDSADANPTVAVFPTSCTTQTPATDPITAEEAGNSGGLRYDGITRTWIFNWSTKQLAAGCFSVRVTTGNSTYATPAGNFPIALRDR